MFGEELSFALPCMYFVKVYLFMCVLFFPFGFECECVSELGFNVPPTRQRGHTETGPRFKVSSERIHIVSLISSRSLSRDRRKPELQWKDLNFRKKNVIFSLVHQARLEPTEMRDLMYKSQHSYLSRPQRLVRNRTADLNLLHSGCNRVNNREKGS